MRFLPDGRARCRWLGTIIKSSKLSGERTELAVLKENFWRYENVRIESRHKDGRYNIGSNGSARRIHERQ
jgi:hypothetical protein